MWESAAAPPPRGIINPTPGARPPPDPPDILPFTGGPGPNLSLYFGPGRPAYFISEVGRGEEL